MQQQVLIVMLGGVLGFAQTAPPAKRAAAPAAVGRWPIASIAIEGTRVYSREQVLTIARLKVGQVAGKAEFEGARDRLLATGAFETVGYKFVQAENGKGYAATLQLTEVEQIYPVDFEDLHVSSLDLDVALRAHDPLYAREGLPATQPVLDRYARWIGEFLATKEIQEKIAGSVQPAVAGGFEVVFRPAKPLPAVAYVTFQGNQAVGQDKLRQAIVGGVGASYTEDTFRQVLNAAIRPLYEDQGYVRVAFPELQIKPAEDVKGVHVFVTVREGAVYGLAKVAIEGPCPLVPATLVSAGDFKPGDSNLHEHVNQGLDKMRQALRHAGYLNAQVFSERRINDDKKTVDVAVRVDAGPQYHMGKLDVEGLDLTAEAEVRRIWTMLEGKPFNPDYPDLFLKSIRAEGMFDNLGETKANVNLDDSAHIAGVTLTFKGAPPQLPGRKGGRGGRGVG